MATYILRRLIVGILIIVVVTVVIFLLLRLLPGDPLVIYTSSEDLQSLSPEQLDALRAQFGLDKPLPLQYISWIGGVLHGDLGLSMFYGEDVKVLLAERLPITLNLGGFAFIASGVLGVLLGVISSLRRGSWLDTIVTFFAYIGITVPGFWLGILLIYFLSLKLGLLPTTGYTSPFTDFTMWAKQVIMPVICLSAFSIASLARQTRSSMLEIIRQDYIRTAWSKGLAERIIIIRHTIKNALIPVITVMGLHIAYIFGGSVLIETVFNIPGIGRLMTASIFQQDYQVVQAITLMMATIVVLTNLLVDISYGWLDPRIRYD